jgi:hypothetical protein
MEDKKTTSEKPFNILSRSTGSTTVSSSKQPHEPDENKTQYGFVDPDDQYSDGRGGAVKKEKNDGDYGEDT